jgi:Fe-S-cluster containining protein
MAFKSVLSPGEPYYRELQDFPYKAKSDGSCEQLAEDGSCKVYDKRPDLCNIALLHERYFSDRTDWFMDWQVRSCNTLIRENGLDEKFLIKNIPDASSNPS